MSKARRLGIAAAARASRRRDDELPAVGVAEPDLTNLDEPQRAPAPESRKRSIAIKLTVIARQLGNRFDQAVECDKLTRAKWSVIVAVARMPGATQRSIAAVLEITEVTAGQLIDKLCADGYLERREHPKDRRAYCVHLTQAAQPLLKRLGELAKVHENETFAGLDDAQLSQLETLLDHVAGNLAACRQRGDEKKSAALPAAD